MPQNNLFWISSRWFKRNVGSSEEARRSGNLSTPNKVQELQKALHVKAKGEPGYRFYALYDKLYRDDVWPHAYARCKTNAGAARWTSTDKSH